MENKDNQSLDKLFQNLERLESIPPSASWGQMEALLDAQQKRKKRGMVWWWAAAAILPFLLVGGWWIGHNTPSKKPLVAIQSNSSAKPVEIKVGKVLPDIQPIEATASTPEKGKNEIKQLARSYAKGHARKVREKKSISPVPNPIIHEPEIETESNPADLASQMESMQPTTQDAQNQMISNENDMGIASIVFHPSQPQDDFEVASVEWKQDQSRKRKLQNTWEKIKNADPEKLPGIENAKESLLALLRFKN